ncbi:DUF3717 domain-containing protein [Burkholderia gladioli]|nr:DUF3717 domain-containing protein [Burkholderia gladioli]
MNMEYTLTDIENAINFWRNKQDSGEDFALCKPARVLAEPYTLMFMTRRERIRADELTPEQQTAMDGARKPPA